MKFVGPLNLFQELMKTKPLGADHLIGIGLGLKYVTFAVTDPYGKVAHRLNVMVREKNISAIVANRIKEAKVPVGLVIGFPFTSSGSPLVLPTMYLIDELRESGKFEGLKYTVWDSADIPKALNPKYEDTVAAIVLQDFLDFGRQWKRVY
ncbi:hypothetical protein Dsin_018820 [Dipteronia sinensis]|uniref:Uncharacterized protein n=1 Tax=Dipteronia sinensis TaxID=43782 RepID=A0AAE0A6V8_9ROSI|nr:hypothetical protein Dsin_018820 [Dipteronia sinensis]